MQDRTMVANLSTTTDKEAEGWLEIGFVRSEAGAVAANWAPLSLPESVRANRYPEICRVGGGYALDLVGHIKRHPGSIDRFVDVMREIVEAGEWTGLEIGFFHAMAGYIAEGRVWLNSDFEIVDMRKAA